MRSYFLKSLENEMEYWWISLFTGLIAIALGVICLIVPKITLVTLSYLFIGAFILSGIIKIIFALSYRYRINDWGFTLVIGIIEILFAIILLILPHNVTIIFLVYLIGFAMLFHAIKAIIESVRLHRMKIEKTGWLIAIAIVSLLFSLFFLLSPIIFKGALIVILTAILFIIYGIVKISLAFSMRSVHKKDKPFDSN
jgi:uncharacterized membrane protein HdeD (DUF308 family)